MNNDNGTLVTLEGLDGSGKSTVHKHLKKKLPDATFTREPTHSWYGDAVYQSITDDNADPLAELFLYTADHADHLSRVIKPALSQGNLVISDRYSDSRYAYQGATLEGEVAAPIQYVQELHDRFSIKPDLTIYLDVDPETATERSGATNKFEQIEYLTRVRNNYEKIIESDSDRFVRIDATKPLQQVQDRIVSLLSEL